MSFPPFEKVEQLAVDIVRPPVVTDIPPPKVEVAVPVTAKVVEVEFVVVDFSPVKFWRVLEARACIPFVTVRRPFVSKDIATEVDVA